MGCNRGCSNDCGCENTCGCNRPISSRRNCRRLANDVAKSLKELFDQAEIIKCTFEALEDSNCIRNTHSDESNCNCNCGCEHSKSANCQCLAEDLEKAICGLFKKIDDAEDAFEDLADAGCIRSVRTSQSDSDDDCDCNCNSCNCGCHRRCNCSCHR